MPSVFLLDGEVSRLESISAKRCLIALLATVVFGRCTSRTASCWWWIGAAVISSDERESVPSIRLCIPSTFRPTIWTSKALVCHGRRPAK